MAPSDRPLSPAVRRLHEEGLEPQPLRAVSPAVERLGGVAVGATPDAQDVPLGDFHGVDVKTERVPNPLATRGYTTFPTG